MSRMDPERFFHLASSGPVSAQEVRHKKLRELFWSIIEEWDEESQIDYSIPLGDMIEMVGMSPEFFIERVGIGDMVHMFAKALGETKPITQRYRYVL